MIEEIRINFRYKLSQAIIRIVSEVAWGLMAGRVTVDWWLWHHETVLIRDVVSLAIVSGIILRTKMIKTCLSVEDKATVWVQRGFIRGLMLLPIRAVFISELLRLC